MDNDPFFEALERLVELARKLGIHPAPVPVQYVDYPISNAMDNISLN